MNTIAKFESHFRVKAGLVKEKEIADALKAYLPVEDSTDAEDKVGKIDRWLAYPTGRVALQIKYRETGRDLLFEVFDTFYGWNHKNNKVGRDMIGDAKEYAVLLKDGKTVVIVPTELAKIVIHRMMWAAEQVWAHINRTFHYRANKCDLQLKEQLDPYDMRRKMVAYIPAEYFAAESKAKIYKINLRQNETNFS
jgi:hypothetical protein